MTYILDSANKKNELIQNCANSHNLTPFTCRQKLYFHDANQDNISDCIAPPIEQWLDSFRQAKFVITDSYHGTIFSIIFNKPFIAIANFKRGTSRFESLLKSLNLEDRLVLKINKKSLELLDKKIDYDVINNKLKELKSDSLNYLLSSLKHPIGTS